MTEGGKCGDAGFRYTGGGSDVVRHGNILAHEPR